MRLPGYCTVCHKFCSSVLVTAPHFGQTQTGICVRCERKQDDERKARYERAKKGRRS